MRKTTRPAAFLEIARTTRINRNQPKPPTGVRFDASIGLLAWDPPQHTDGITHYKIYANTEDQLGLVRMVPVSQTYLQDNLVADRVFITAFNLTIGLESPPAVLEQVISPAAGSAVFDLVITASNDPVDEPPAIAGAPLNTRLTVFLQQDSTGGWQPIVWGPEFKGHGGNIGTDPNMITVFEYIKKSNTNPKWWAVGVPISYV